MLVAASGVREIRSQQIVPQNHTARDGDHQNDRSDTVDKQRPLKRRTRADEQQIQPEGNRHEHGE